MVSGDNATIDFENKIPYMYDWRPREDGEVVNNFAKQEFEEKLKAFTDKATEKVKTETIADYELKVKEAQEKIDITTSDFSKLTSEFEILKQTNTSLLEFKSTVEVAQQEAFESQQKELKTELIENFSRVLTAEEIKSVKDENLSIEAMETKFKLMFASKELSTKFNKKPKKTETEIPILFTTKKSDNDSWTSCIKK